MPSTPTGRDFDGRSFGGGWRRSPLPEEPRTAPSYSRDAYREPVNDAMFSPLSQRSEVGPIRISHRYHQGTLPHNQRPVYLARQAIQRLSLEPYGYYQGDEADSPPQTPNFHQNVADYQNNGRNDQYYRIDDRNPLDNHYGIQEPRASVFDRLSLVDYEDPGNEADNHEDVDHEDDDHGDDDHEEDDHEDEAVLEPQQADSQQQVKLKEQLLKKMEDSKRRGVDMEEYIQLLIEENRKEAQTLQVARLVYRKLKSDRFEPYPARDLRKSLKNTAAPMKTVGPVGHLDVSYRQDRSDREDRRNSSSSDRRSSSGSHSDGTPRRDHRHLETMSSRSSRRDSRMQEEAGAYRPQMKTSAEELEGWVSSKLSASTAHLSSEDREKHRRRQQEIRELEERKYKHPISDGCRESFTSCVTKIRTLIKCDLFYNSYDFEAKTGHRPEYVYVTLESDNREEIDEARVIIDNLVMDSLFTKCEYETNKMNKMVDFAYYISKRAKRAFKEQLDCYKDWQTKGWDIIKQKGRAVGVEVTPPYGTDCNPPCILSGKFEDVEYFKTALDGVVDDYYKKHKRIEKVLDFPLHIFSEFVGHRGSSILDLEKKTNTRIYISKKEEKVEIVGKTEEDIEVVKARIDELRAERKKKIQEMMAQGYVYKISVDVDKIGKLIGSHGAQIREIREKSGARCELDEERQTDGTKNVYVGGTLQQAQDAHHMVNQIVGNGPKRRDYTFIAAENIGLYKRINPKIERLAKLREKLGLDPASQ